MSKITVSQYEDKAEYLRQWRAKNPDKCKEYYDKRDKEEIREKAWLRRYGITREWYNRTLEDQGGCCAICNSPEIGRKGHTHFHVDHNHYTGEVRGLLCDLCNRGLGYFKDNENLLVNAANYLEKHSK
jgi:hypothetical protein